MRRGIRAHVANNVNSQNAASQRSQHPASQQSQLPDTQPGLVEVDGNSQPAVVVWGRLCSRRTEIKSLGKRQKTLHVSNRDFRLGTYVNLFWGYNYKILSRLDD